MNKFQFSLMGILLLLSCLYITYKVVKVHKEEPQEDHFLNIMSDDPYTSMRYRY